ncbi:hypothetical protein BHE74_00016509 [Ensete ventricosum]|uniref:Uncharacterized protein n=1 Tax=Ensete ventricosum TaxID=4639 RepID=A0A444CJG3_ENSVE|nr:hypothetical protein B296_00035179 [Ensete ventricosum]RWV86048.1 hypothetical protein GW17_00052102 [Ensete ventricosum]RWW75464.1 hypothetical protein BHE74_00016509 [Ensete ventricosum]RZS18039.1 hypothetical protein BHM03_00050258 [Ensete ventricosum]
MAPQSTGLDKVGREAFDMIEVYLGRRGRPLLHRSFHHHNTPPKKEPMLDSIQAAKQFNGVLFVESAGLKQRHWEASRGFA